MFKDEKFINIISKQWLALSETMSNEFQYLYLSEKCPNKESFLVRIFPYSD